MNYSLDPNWEGWVEIVVGVQDLTTAAEPLIKSAGWEILTEGPADAALTEAWQLPANVSVDECMIHIPETYGGFIRFVKFDGAEVQRVRPEGQKNWDPGGILLFNIRSRDSDKSSRALHAAGYPSPIGAHKFEFDFLTVKEAVHHGPDGMCLSVLQQIIPPVDPPEAYSNTSRAFNAQIVTKDFAKSRSFFVDQLGFKPWVETVWDKDSEGLRILAPIETFGDVDSIDVSIVHPQAGNFGSIELVAYNGDLDRQDFTTRAAPPALGNLMFRFFTPDLDAKLSLFKTTGVSLRGEPVSYQLKPYGNVRSVIVESPDGVWLEFFECVE